MKDRAARRQAGERRPASGFTLTELAIVLGIIGLILGAIWVAATRVYANNRTNKVSTEVLAVANSARALFSSRGAVPAGYLTPFAVKAGFYPSDMLQQTVTCTNSSATPCPQTPWNSDMELVSQIGESGVLSDTGHFEVWITSAHGGGVPVANCPTLMATIVGQAASSGLVYIASDSGGGSLAVTSTTALTDPHITKCGGNVVFQFQL